MRKIIFIILITPLFTYGQLPKDIIWQSCYGTSESDEAYDLLETPYAYYILSETDDVISSNSGTDILLTKINNTGELIWQKIYGGSLADFPKTLITDNGGNIYIGAGTYSDDGDVQSGNKGGEDAWVIKIDTLGTIVWEKTYGGSRDDYSAKLLYLENGNILLYTATLSYDYDVSINYGYLDIWMAEITPDGEIVQSKVFGSSFPDNIFSLIQTSDGGFFTAARAGKNDGMVDGIPRGGDDVWLLKLDAQLNIEWQKLIGGSKYDSGGYGLTELYDGGYIFNGTTQSFNGDVHGFAYPDVPNQDDNWVVRLDSEGNIIWDNALGGDNWEYSSKVFPNEDGTFTVFGTTSSMNNGDVEGHHYHQSNPNFPNDDIWMVHLSAVGEILDQRCFGNTGYDKIYRGVIKKSDFHYLLAGTAWSLPNDTIGDVNGGYESDSYDIWFFEIVDCEYFQPEVPANIEGEDSVCTLNTTESTYTTQIINPQYEEAQWQMLPAEAGELTNLQDSAIIYWNTGFEGQVELSVRSTNSCGESDYSEPKLIEVRSCVGVGEIWQRELKTYPNPANTQVTFELPEIKKTSILHIKDVFGKTVKEVSLLREQTLFVWDCSQMTGGVYFYQTQINREVYRGKIVVN